jgi:uncharacterized protein YjgD (DUF1641 family)
MEQAVEVADLASLSRKLDLLAEQVQYLTEQAERNARRQEERAELMHDALPIANQAFELVTEQLEEVQGYVDLSDLLRLVKRLLRNGRNLDKMLDQLESLLDLGATAGPLADSAFEKATDLLQAAEQKGYFTVARGGAHVVDELVLAISRGELSEPVDASLRSLWRDLRDPEVRRGLSVIMRLLRLIGRQAPVK